ncbi:MAG TPA: TauD/TfdA family dioxygenase [Allosphingosinicella sp.]|nr:TauD/TfdA family dioxygenase [Allosphingosinicella sp.]
MSLVAKPILPNFGAEMSGVDLMAPLAAATVREILNAQDRYGVTVWRGTGLDDEGHVAFSRLFGYLEGGSKTNVGPRRLKHAELIDVGNLDIDGNIVSNELTRAQKRGDRLWHTDGSFIAKRSAYSLLMAHEVPTEGGETWFADTRTAYDDLPRPMKDRLEGLVAQHSYWWSRKQAGFPISEEELDAKPVARHPLVHVHKGSGRKALYIASHARDIEGLPRKEGRALLAELIAHATQPRYVFKVRWNPGDLVCWDNLCSMHRGGEFDDERQRRDMRRTTVREGPAPDVPDDPYAEMFKTSEFAFMAAGRK